MRLNLKRNMRGVSVISLLIVAIVIVFAVTISVNLVPPYLQHYAVKGVLKDLATNPELAQMTKAKLRDLFIRKLQVNYITNVNPEALVIDKKADDTYLALKYEVRVHLISNIDAVFMFDDEVKVEKNAKF